MTDQCVQKLSMTAFSSHIVPSGYCSPTETYSDWLTPFSVLYTMYKCCCTWCCSIRVDIAHWTPVSTYTSVLSFVAVLSSLPLCLSRVASTKLCRMRHLTSAYRTYLKNEQWHKETCLNERNASSPPLCKSSSLECYILLPGFGPLAKEQYS